MKISILMSTYNGEKYIQEQLSSIYFQSRKPDEVIILDDCSSDGTVDVVKKFINEHGLRETWKIYRNNENKGWRINFIDGIKYVSGDILFFSDQDDIWFNNKIEKYIDILNSNHSINVVASKEILWKSGDLKPVCRVDDNSYIFLDLAQEPNSYLIHTSGCCMCLQMNYVKKVLPYCFPGWAHDDFFWKMSILDGSLAFMNSSSVLHRITGVNESRKKTTLEKSVWGVNIDIKVAEQLLKRLREEKNIKDMDKKKRIAEHKLEGSKAKRKMLKNKNPFLFIKILIKYSDIYRRKRQLVGDYLRAIGIMS